MKVGDLIMDNELGQTGIILEFVKRREPNDYFRACGVWVHDYYRCLFEDGTSELVCAAVDDIEVINESR